MTQSKRFAILAERPINQETFVEEWPEAGLMVTDSPHDPAPSLRIENGQVVTEIDGKAHVPTSTRLTTLLRTHGLDLVRWPRKRWQPTSQQLARMLVDINVSAAKVRRLGRWAVHPPSSATLCATSTCSK